MYLSKTANTTVFDIIVDITTRSVLYRQQLCHSRFTTTL